MRASEATQSPVKAKPLAAILLCVWLLVSPAPIVSHAQAQVVPPQLSLGIEAPQQDDLASSMPRERVRESRIRSIAVWRYPVGPDGTEGDGTRVALMTYDRHGNPREQRVFGEGGTSQTPPAYTYDEDGRIAEATYSHGQLPGVVRMTLHYDDDGRLTEFVCYREDGTRGPTVRYEYDASGRPLEVNAATDGGDVLYKMMLEYEPEGKISRVAVLGPGGRGIVSTKVLVHDTNGRPIEQITSDGKGRVLARTTYTYNAAGNPTEVAAFNGEGRAVSLLSYSYDERGNITQIVQAYPAARLRTRTDLRYDADGNLLEQVLYNKLDRPVEIIRYVYDHYRDR